jgi:O-antigen ligase
MLVPGGADLLGAAAPETGWRPLSLDPRGTLLAACLALAYAGSAWTLATAARSAGFRNLVLAVMAVGGTALAVFGMVQHATQTEPATIYWRYPIYEIATPYGPYVNRNHFAGAMEVTAAITAAAAFAAWADGRRILAVLAVAGLLAQLAALAGTQSRGGLVGAAAGGAFLLWCALAAGSGGRRGRTKRVLVAAGVVAALVALLWFLGLLRPLLDRVEIAPRSMNRFLVQRDSLAAFAAQPLAGAGAGSFERVFPAYQRLNDTRSFSNGHSDWTQLLMETGLLGAAGAAAAIGAVVAAVVAAVAGARRTLSRPYGVNRVHWHVFGPAAGLAALVVHGIFDVNLHVPANALLAVVAASLASAASNDCGRVAAGSSPAPPSA